MLSFVMSYQIMAAKGCVNDVSALLRKLSLVDGEVIMLKAHRIMGPEHVHSAVYHAMRAFKRGKNFARTMGVETLLYLSGERQISKALNYMGLESGDEEIAIITFGNQGDDLISSLGWIRDDSLLQINEEKKRFMLETMGGSTNIEPLKQILEKVALLDIDK